MERHPVILFIAGSDCSGGTGIQADIRTISALRGHAASAITAVAVRNTLGVRTVHAVPPGIVCGQIEAVMRDLQPVAMKTGMVNSIQIIRIIIDCIRKYSPGHITYDLVMASTSGRKPMTNETIEEIKKKLLPLVTLITPNIDEAKVLTGKSIRNTQDMLEVAKQLSNSYQIHILIKSGHLRGDQICDLLYFPDHIYYIYEKREVKSKNLCGTGRAPSSAIASCLVKGYSMKESIRHAKEYITHAIIAGRDLNIGHDNGPLWHFPNSIAQMCTFCAVVS